VGRLLRTTRGGWNERGRPERSCANPGSHPGSHIAQNDVSQISTRAIHRSSREQAARTASPVKAVRTVTAVLLNGRRISTRSFFAQFMQYVHRGVRRFEGYENMIMIGGSNDIAADSCGP
jgi:hypothetical protein